MEVGIGVQHLRQPNVTINFSQVKVNVQGQNHRTENLTPVIVRPGCTCLHQIWQSDRSNFGMHDSTKFKMAAYSGGLHSLSLFF